MRVRSLKPRTGTLILVAGLVVGSGATLSLHAPSPAFAQQATSGSMEMPSKTAGDAEMNAAMKRMMQTMDASKTTGVQDRDFMMMMVPHHQSAVDMAKIELRRGTRPELKALARDIIKSQNEEIGQMRGWLKAWYLPASRHR